MVDDPYPATVAGPVVLVLTEGASLLLLCCGLGLLTIALATCRYGLDSFSRSKLLEAVPDGERRRRMERILGDLDRIRIATMYLWILGEAGFLLALVRGMALLLHDEQPFSPVPITVALLIASVFQMAIGRILPRLAMTHHAEATMLVLLPWLRRLTLLLYPVVVPLNAWRKLASRMLRSEPLSLDESFSEEIIAKVAEGERDGVVAEDEAEMIENVVEFRDVEVSEVMTPRTDVDWVAADDTVQHAVRVAAKKGHSRLPVGEDDSDHIIGVFYVRDVVHRMDEYERIKTAKVREFCRRPFFVPESKSIKELLQEFRQSKVHIAIVLDEYGGTAGIVTIEDILEEIVGDIDDEYDETPTSPILRLIDADHAEVDARAHIDEVNEALSIELPESDDFDTLGGFVFTTLGRVPEAGEVITWDGVDIQVLEADERRVKRLDLRVLTRNGLGDERVRG